MVAPEFSLDLASEVNPGLALRIGRPRNVLELGCGAGVNGMLARRFGAHVTGVENDARLAARAELVLDEVLPLDASDDAALERQLAGRSFDLVLIPYLLEFVDAPERLVATAARHLAPEGRLLFSVRNSEALPRRFGVDYARLGFGRTTGKIPRFFSAEATRKLALDAGLELLESAFNPMLAKTLRAALGENAFVSSKREEDAPSGFRDFSLYEAYRHAVLPFEVTAANLSPALFAYQHVIAARKKPRPGPLSLTVGMLTMDEEPSVARMIDEIRRHAPDAKLLLVDSSVKDHTPLIAERMGARVLRQLPPRGHGPAMELLMYEAANAGDALVYLDCDFTYAPENIPQIRAILESGADVVNAARTRTRPRAMPFSNYVANKTFVWCARALDGVPIADLHSGMRGYRSSLIRNFSFDGRGDALPIDTLLWPARSGYRVVEVPIDYQERVGVSKLRKLAGTAWTFVRLLRTLEVGARGNGNYEVWPRQHGAEP